MSYSVGKLDVACPKCQKPISVLLEAEIVNRHVLPGVASNGSLTVLVGVNQVALDQELAGHFDGCFDECHASPPSSR